MEIKPIFLTAEIHPKKWGQESWICNNEEFCGKILYFNKGAQFSGHFHIKKREVFLVLKGKIDLMTINPTNAKQEHYCLCEGDIVEIPRFLTHQIHAIEESQVVEFSTKHEETDSVRVIPGDSQK